MLQMISVTWRCHHDMEASSGRLTKKDLQHTRGKRKSERAYVSFKIVERLHLDANEPKDTSHESTTGPRNMRRKFQIPVICFKKLAGPHVASTLHRVQP